MTKTTTNPPSIRLGRRLLLLAVGLAAVVASLAIFSAVFSHLDKNRGEEQDAGFHTNPDWPRWANELGLRLEEQPDWKAKKIADYSGMVEIPAGRTQIGCWDQCIGESSTPPREIDIPTFYMDRSPATRRQYDTCVKNHLCLPLSPPPFDLPDDPNLPVLVDMTRAKRFCIVQGKRLPTENEWEKAARGTDGHRYPWGNEPADSTRGNLCDKNCEMAWADETLDDGYKWLSPVGAFPAGNSPYGLTDMAGNVKQWVDGDSPVPDTEAIAKGSSWYSTADQAASHVRQDWRAGIRLDDKGVRCAADPTVSGQKPAQ